MRFLYQKQEQLEGVRNVVLCRGWWTVGWQGIYDLLKKDGYNVSIVQYEVSCVLRRRM
jgi:hypothetical protein